MVSKRIALLEDGELAVPEGHYRNYDDMELGLAHFMAADTSRAIDFIEYMCHSQFMDWYMPLNGINNILREEGIGFEFSPYVYKTYDTPQGPKPTVDLAVYPEATKKTDEAVHRDVVMPALKVLGRNEFAAANTHILAAHEHYRHGHRREAITECLSALETTLKTICQVKQWQYRQDKDTLGALVDVAKEHGLVFDFYDQPLKSTGTIRSRLGAHGTEPTPTYEPNDVHVEHMIHTTSAHILMLIRLADR